VAKCTDTAPSSPLTRCTVIVFEPPPSPTLYDEALNLICPGFDCPACTVIVPDMPTPPEPPWTWQW
jgi:hypothetical protein